MKDFSIVGFWKFKSNRVRQEDGSWITDHLFGGTMAFSENGQAVLFLRSEQGNWGYCGTYRMSGDHCIIQIETSSAEGLDGTVLERTAHFLHANELKFSGLESHTGRLFETEFIRC